MYLYWRQPVLVDARNNEEQSWALGPSTSKSGKVFLESKFWENLEKNQNLEKSASKDKNLWRTSSFQVGCKTFLANNWSFSQSVLIFESTVDALLKNWYFYQLFILLSKACSTKLSILIIIMIMIIILITIIMIIYSC